MPVDELTEPLASPSVAYHQASAEELLAWANGHIEALEQLLAQSQSFPHAETIVPMLRADLAIWKQVATLATLEQPSGRQADDAP